jgi:hypothetical protein
VGEAPLAAKMAEQNIFSLLTPIVFVRAYARKFHTFCLFFQLCCFFTYSKRGSNYILLPAIHFHPKKKQPTQPKQTTKNFHHVFAFPDIIKSNLFP